MNFKKLLSAIGLLTIAVPTTLSVVACGPAVYSTIALKDIIKVTTIPGSLDDTESTVVDKVVATNQGVTKNDIVVKAGSFHNADYNQTGSAIIIAKVSKFTDEVSIKIEAVAQTDLKDAIENKSVQGEEGDNEVKIFDKVLVANKSLTQDDIQVQPGSFHNADYDNPGSIIIEPKSPKFIGTATIAIKSWIKTDLKDVITETTVIGNFFNDQTLALNEILKLNSNSGVTQDDVYIDQFEEATYEKDGKAIIFAVPESKFKESVNITVTKLSQNLSDQEIVDIFKREINNIDPEIISIPQPEPVEQFKSNVMELMPALAWLILQHYRDDFQINKLKIHNITINDKELTDEDLEPNDIKILNLNFNFEYGTVMNDNIIVRIFKKY